MGQKRLRCWRHKAEIIDRILRPPLSIPFGENDIVAVEPPVRDDSEEHGYPEE